MNKKIERAMKHIGIQYRDIDLNRAEIDEENRTVPLAFSSEQPVERFWGTEILDHDPKSVDLGRLNGGGAVLVDHNMSDQVGVVESAAIDKDRRGRAIVRFGRSERAKEIFNDIIDGIRKHVSVGYRIHEMVENSKTNSFRATSWEPYEVSIVGIPADATVGVQRDADADNFETTIIREVETVAEETTKTETREQPAPAPAKADPADMQRQIKEARKDELKRINEITALGREHNLEEDANKACSEGMEVDQFRVHVLDALKNSQPIARPESEIGITKKEAKRFSYARAIYALANPQSRQAQEAAGFEIECSRAVAQARGIDPKGFFVPEMTRSGFVPTDGEGRHVPGISVPLEVQNLTRADLNATTDAQGGHLVATDLMSGSFIDVLRNMLAVAGMGATVMSDLQGDIAIPAKLAAGSSAWLATEGADAVQSDMTFRQVTMTPKTAATFTEYTRQLLLQSSIDVDMLIRDDIARGMALLLDSAALYGTAANGQPRGVANTTGIGNPTTWAGTTPTWAEVVEMESVVATANALEGSLGYIMEAAMRGSLKTTSKAGTEAIFIMGEGSELNGYNAKVSNQITSGDIFFGNWSDLLLGFWGTLDLLVDPYTHSLSGTTRVVAHQSTDVAVRHAASFALGNDTI